MKKLYISIILLLLTAISISAQNTERETDKPIQIEGTDLARLPSVMEVLSLLPGIAVHDDAVTVIGRGTPSIYVGNKKITEITDLYNISADMVKNIDILKHPGAQFGKDVEAIIIIRLKSDSKEGFTLNNVLNLTASHKFSPSEKLTVGWKHKKLTLGALLGWEEKRKKTEKESFTYKYNENKELIDTKTRTTHPESASQTLHAGATAVYEFDANNDLSFVYTLTYKQTDNSYTEETKQFGEHPTAHHDFALEYGGQFGKWNLSVGNNSFVDIDDQTTYKPNDVKSYYKRKQFNIRTYAKASTPLWKGDLAFGVEHQYYNMDATLYDDDPSVSDTFAQYLKSHATHPDNTLAAFVSTQQTLGRWTIDAGVRYEHYNTIYRPCEDDALTCFFRNESDDVIEQLKAAAPMAETLQRDGKLVYRKGKLYPSLRVSTQLGKSELSLKTSQSYISPDFAITRLRLTETELWDQKVLWSEVVTATSLGWKYRWVDFGATHKFFQNPICETVSSTNKYNAPDYHALILDLTLSPQIGIWTPMLQATFQKQWFHMPLASGKDRLTKPMGTVTFNNTLTLPYDWLIRCNAFWRSKGANRNNYYFSPMINIDASIQKSFPRVGLTFILSAQNLLYNNYNDFGRYTKSIYSVSEGSRERTPRHFSLTVQYKL